MDMNDIILQIICLSTDNIRMEQSIVLYYTGLNHETTNCEI